MRDGADEFTILDDRRAGHALDDAAGGFQQGRVGDTDEHIPAVFPGCGIYFYNFHRILPGRIPGNCGKNRGIAGSDFIRPTHRQGLAPPGSTASKNTLGSISLQGAGSAPAADITHELPRLTGFSQSHGHHPGWVDHSPDHRQKPPGRIADAMAQRPEGHGLRIIVSDGTDSCDTLPQIHTQLRPLVCDFWLHPVGLLTVAPPDSNLDTAAAAIQGRLHIFRCFDLSAVDGYQPIPRLQARRLRRRACLKGRYRDGVVMNFDANDLSAGNQSFRRLGPCGQ